MTTVTTLTRGVVGEDAQRVLSVIRQAGGRPMLVGGCVRDAILHPGQPAKDIDVEVYGLPDFGQLAAALAGSGFTVNEVGVSFGVLLVRAGTTAMDISLPRRDSKTGAGHRGFTVTPDTTLGFAEASSRREHTIGALMADPVTGEVIDCHGGLADLASGVLRHIGAAFTEDPLRVLRAVQFAARFSFRLAPETAALCRTIVGTCSELATERVWGEFWKLGVMGKDITAGLAVLEQTGWERHFPPLAILHAVPQDPEWHPEGDVHIHSGLAADQAARLADEGGLTGEDRFVVVMAALAHDFGKVTHTQRLGARIISHGHAEAGVEPARAFLRFIGCPEGVTARILPLVREHMNCFGQPAKPAVRRLVRRLVPATLTELALVCAADAKGRGDPDAWSTADAWFELGHDLQVTERPPKGLLTGDHLIAAGMTPGPAFRPLLAAALEAQDAGEFDDEAAALRWLEAHMEVA